VYVLGGFFSRLTGKGKIEHNKKERRELQFLERKEEETDALSKPQLFFVDF